MVLSKFTILCQAAFIAILGCMWPAGPGLDSPLDHLEGLQEKVDDNFSRPNARSL